MKKISGFTLIELTIFLMVVGLTGSLFLNTSGTYYLQRKIVLTKKKQEKLTHSLAAYFLVHCRLPLPSTPFSAIGESDLNNGQRIIEGIIPYKTLGLPEDAAKDGFGHYFTYVLATEFNNQSAWENFKESHNIIYQGLGVLQVNEDCFQPTPKNATLSIPFVLISHGLKGWGCYYKQGQSLNFPILTSLMTQQMGIAERKNFSGNFTRRVYENRSFNPEGRERFDQIIYWVVQGQFLTEYVKMMPARLAESLKNNGFNSSISTAENFLGKTHTNTNEPSVSINVNIPLAEQTEIDPILQNGLYENLKKNQLVV